MTALSLVEQNSMQRSYNKRYLEAKSNAISVSIKNKISPIFILEAKRKINNIKNLNIASKLEFNWNDNGALPFPKGLIDKCKNILVDIIIQPKLFPTANQSIQMEYEKENGDYLEFEIYEDTIEVFIAYEDGRELEKSIPCDVKYINKEVREFYETSC